MNKLEIFKNEFLNYLRILNRSKSTIAIYKLSLDFYIKFLKLKNIEAEYYYSLRIINDYKKYLDEAKNKARLTFFSEKTKLNYFSNLSIFFRYLLDNQIIFVNPFDKIGGIKKASTLPKNIPRENEIAQIINSIPLNKPCNYRDRVIFEVTYSSGIRRMEIANLTIYDIDLNGGFIHIKKGKGAKDRIIPVGKTAVRLLSYYISEIRPRLLKNNFSEQALFLSCRGKKLEPVSIQYIFYSRIIKSNIGKKFSCHSFRHACATEMLKGGASIKHVQEMLGHSSLASTQIYTRIQPEDLLEVHKKTHPSWTLFDDE